jgi:AraC family transcriptional regulator
LDWGDLPGDAAAFVDGDGVNTALRFAEQLALRNPASCSMEAMCWELVSTVTGVKFWPDNAHPSWKRRAWVGQARELLRDRCSDSMHIAEMARQLEVHPVYFARAFRQVFHCTPGEYRMRCRLRDAMALLQNAEFPLSEIAYRSGFFDQSHFTNSFREHFGISPYAYRSRLGSIGTRRSFAAEPY